MLSKFSVKFLGIICTIAVLGSAAFVPLNLLANAAAIPVENNENDEPIRILAIGNSYACNATEYIDRIAENLGLNVETYVLYYGGCSIKQHVNFYNDEREVYALCTNGENFDWSVNTMQKAFALFDYDIVTIQEMPSADNFATYWTENEPYLTDLVDIIKENEPGAKIMVHQTWSHCTECIKTHYHQNSGNYNNSAENFAQIEATYLQAAEKIGLTADDIIPSGKAVQITKDDFGFGDFYNTKEDGSEPTTEEGYLSNGALYTDPICHLNRRGRYLASCVWVEKLFGVDAREISYVPDVLDTKECELLREIAHEAVSGEQYCVEGDWRYLPNGDGVKVMRYLGTVPAHGIIEIPASLGGKTVNAIAAGVFKNYEGIKHLYIPEGELDIEEGALAINAVNRIPVNALTFDTQETSFFANWWNTYYYAERTKNFLIDTARPNLTVLSNNNGKYSSLDHTGNGGFSVTTKKDYYASSNQHKSVTIKIMQLFGADKQYFDQNDLGKTYSISFWVYLEQCANGQSEKVEYGLMPVAQLATEESVGYHFYGDTYGSSVDVGEWTRLSFEVTLDETHVGNNQVGLLGIYLADAWSQTSGDNVSVIHIDDIKVDLIEKGQIPIDRGEAVIPEGYDVTFMNGDEVYATEEYLVEGSEFAINQAVANTETHYFAGWYLDKELTVQARTTLTIEGDVTLYAKMLPYKTGLTINSDTEPTSANYWNGWAASKHTVQEPTWYSYRGYLAAYGVYNGKYGDLIDEGNAHRHSGFTTSGSTKQNGKEVRNVSKGAVWDWIFNGDYILRDENGDAFMVKPNTTYKVTLTYTNTRGADIDETATSKVHLSTGLPAFNLIYSSELKLSDLKEGTCDTFGAAFEDTSEGSLAFNLETSDVILEETTTAKTVELTITTPSLDTYKNSNLLQVLSISDTVSRGMIMTWESVVVEEVIDNETEYETGDVDGNGKVDTTDLAVLKKLVAGLISKDDDTAKYPDIDLDGNVNTTDLAMLKKHIAGLEVISPKPSVDIDYEDKNSWTDPV